MKKTVLIDLSFYELDQLTEETSVCIADDYKRYGVDQLETFVKNAGFLLDNMKGLQCGPNSELASYLFDSYWNYCHEISVDTPLFLLVEKHFFSCVELAITVTAGGATDE